MCSLTTRNFSLVMTFDSPGNHEGLATPLLLFLLRFIHYAMVRVLHASFFIASIFWLVNKKGEESLKRCWWIVLFILIMSHLMAKSIASSIKIITTPGWFHNETYMCVLGLWFAITAATKIILKWCHDYETCSIFCLNKIDLHAWLQWYSVNTY